MPIRLTLRSLTPWLLIAAVGGLAAAVRFLFIEPAAIGETCEAQAALWWCSPRLLLVQGFLHHIYGWAAVAAAIASLAVRRPWLAMLAAALGVFSMVLYGVELGSFALLVGVLREARLRAGGSPLDENGHGQQHVNATP
ncbi:hypothetical protein [Pinirhizobacter soli]|uniref:hypothetical protein n=1 Tax=Pinirhizobacter soli TaxID=2786953 RepID=UPI00202A9BBA|nr:hypothetical protein [Pinirhizobacter soli]